jgi:hypothetical protein
MKDGWRVHACLLTVLAGAGCSIEQPAWGDCVFGCAYGSSAPQCPGDQACLEDNFCHRKGHTGLCGAPSDAGLGEDTTGPATCDAPCEGALRCNNGRCVTPPVACRDQKRIDPDSPDGIYWLNWPAFGIDPFQTYCDMQQKVELCSTLEGEHQGRTRDSSQLEYLFTSVLNPDQGICTFWALRGALDSYPFSQLEPKDAAGNPTGAMSTCAALGFVGDQSIGSYPSGGPGIMYHKYGNVCPSCDEGKGVFDHYVRQGFSYEATVITSMDGSVRSSCRVR